MLKIIQINSTDTTPLTNQLNKLAKKNNTRTHLVVNKKLSSVELTEFEQFIQTHKPFPFNKLSLQVDTSLIQDPHFLNSLKELHGKAFVGLELIFTGTAKELTDSAPLVEKKLIETLAPLVSYPVQIKEIEDGGLPSSRINLNEFQSAVINQIHKHNKDKDSFSNAAHFGIPNTSYTKKIKLKETIASKTKNKLKGNDASQYIALEVQHVETVEQQIIAQQELIYEAQTQLQEIQPFTGDLIGFAEFSSPVYKKQVEKTVADAESVEKLYQLVGKELFANLPHAIKYVSPAAAEQLAQNLPGLVTLNKDNLPQGFVLKKSAKGELVLDYDAFLPEHEKPFTPKEFRPWDDIAPIYDIKLKERDLKQWIGDDLLFQTFCYKNEIYQPPKQLINIWIKQGAEGITRWFKSLKTLQESNPQLLTFLQHHYLNFLPQWEHLSENEYFFKALERISHYDEQKLMCFKQFLINTGSSRHDLTQTAAAFDVFWNELSALCAQSKIPVSRINTTWSTPLGGNPVVYMERMLCLLKNCRDLDDQFKGLAGLTLDNYGAYYASKYEDFKSVSPAMELNYNADRENKRPFDLNYHLYRVTLDGVIDAINRSSEFDWLERFASYSEESYWLINMEKAHSDSLNLEQLKQNGLAKPYKKKDFIPPYHVYEKNKEGNLALLYRTPPSLRKDCYRLGFRFIGQQTAGIMASSFSEQFLTLVKDYWVPITEQLISCLFFVSHERFLGDKPLEHLFSAFDGANNHDVLQDTNKYLRQLYKLDTKLNEAEGLELLRLMGGMNSAEFEGLGLSKKDIMEKLMTQLQLNKFGTLKMLQFRAKSGSIKWPAIYALDTAEFLAKDQAIEGVYHDDLLLFATLINSERHEAYFHNRKDGDLSQVKANLEKVKSWLHKAATQETPNNLHYAVQLVLNSRQFFTYAQFINAFTQIQALPSFDNHQVAVLLRQHGFTMGMELPQIFKRDNADLKEMMIQLIMDLSQAANKDAPVQSSQELRSSKMYADLHAQSIEELQPLLKQKWKESSFLLGIRGKLFQSQRLKIFKEASINSAFGLPTKHEFLNSLAEKMQNFPEFQDHSDFDKVDRIDAQAHTLAALFKQVLMNPHVQAREKEFIDLLGIDRFKMDYEMVFATLTWLVNMPQRDYSGLLKTVLPFTHNKEQYLELITFLSLLNSNYFPSHYLESFSRRFIKYPRGIDNELVDQLIAIYTKNNRDPLLEWVLLQDSLSIRQIHQILEFSQTVEQNRDKLTLLLKSLDVTNNLSSFLKELTPLKPLSQMYILEIITKSYAIQRSNTLNKQPVNFTALVGSLAGLSEDNLKRLHTFYQATPMSVECLEHGLKSPKINDDFQSFLLQFEKAPFGERDLQQQFNCSEVERVINSSSDLINESTYPYAYRKQLMEAFLFVNQIGEHLPVYNNKAAKDLSNAEIRALFADLKSKKNLQLTPFQSRLLALGLMREAMYRSTGEFPYSTQIIALIDATMHQGDLISNIDTGQGKSLIDSMKASLLWLDSDRVDLSTSSLVDANRDIANYGPYLKLLGIPYSEQPISSVSSIEQFQRQGINFSTFAQLSLFFSKAKVMGVTLDTPATKVSLVANESDYAILDDRVTYRFASADGAGVSFGQEWIYDTINEFVTSNGTNEFINNHKTSVQEDINDLKAYIKTKAQLLKKSPKLVDKFSDEQYLSWIESSLMVNYQLQEKEDYVIPEGFEKRVINGVSLPSKVIKILMKDGKVSPDSTFGNGMQQLLYAKLNKQTDSNDFVIEPQNKTIISTNNKNLLAYYRSRKGFIWGSSGTVGSRAEIEEQYKKYGFEFTKAEPHQKNQVQFNVPVVLPDETRQFNELIRQITLTQLTKTSAPSIVFCKNIETATRFFNLYQSLSTKKFPAQLYTGLGMEEAYIAKASEPGMITFTTSALGRNTDIHYDKKIGMNVWHTMIDTTRNLGQKSGRTGRQGSVGQVHYVLNSDDLKNQSKEEISRSMDDISAEERRVNEELYDVLGYLLAQIELLPDTQFLKVKKAFIREEWARFSDQTETRFREFKRQIPFDKVAFIKDTLDSYYDVLEFALKSTPKKITPEELCKTIALQHAPKGDYKSFAGQVKMSDCISPMTIAYHLLNFQAQDLSADLSKKAIKEKLKSLFSDSSDTHKHSEYLSYLQSNPSTQEVVVTAHKEFLAEFLSQKSQKGNVFKCWLGYEGTLNRMVSNPEYLMMFQAFAAIPANKPIVELDVLKNSIVTLLDEYLENSWFIGNEKRAEALSLKQLIGGATDVNAILDLLAKSQVKMAQTDIELSAHRRIKSVNFFGTSRYQTTLNRAINLTTSLSKVSKVDDLTLGLIDLVPELKGRTLTEITHDDLKHFAATSSGNQKVIASSLENALAIKHRQEPVGMTGRDGFFNLKQEKGDLDVGMLGDVGVKRT